MTDRRVLILAGTRWNSSTTLALKTLPAITLSERRDGLGDVVFAATDAGHVAAGGLVPKGSSVPVMFELVAQPRHVYDVIRGAQRQAV